MEVERGDDHGSDPEPVTISLVDDGRRMDMLRATSVVGRIDLDWPPDRGELVATVTFPALERCNLIDATKIVRAIADHATTSGAPLISVSSNDALVRYAARSLGLRGALRAPLRGVIGRETTTSLEAAAHELVPHLQLDIIRIPARRRWFGRSDPTPTLTMTVTAPRCSFLVRVPDFDDLMPEALLGAIDVAVTALGRYAHDGVYLRHLVFVPALPTYGGRLVAGTANANVGVIQLNASLVSAEQSAWLRQKAARQPPRRAPAEPAPPWTALDATTAHEMWHQIEGAFTAHRWDDSVTFRRALGDALGVPTIEFAIKGRLPNATAHERAAYARLRDEISDYATTNPWEATAEIFKRWWCDPVRSPIVECMNDMLDRYFPSRGAVN